MAATLAQLRARAQVIYDVSGSTVLATAEWNDLVNDAYRALWADVVSVNNDFRNTVLPFVLTTGNTQALPADFQDARFVRINPGQDTQMYLPKYPAKAASEMFDRSYRLQGVNLIIEPIQRAAGSYDLTYVPQPPVLVADGDTLDIELDQFRDYLVYHTAVAAMAREESAIEQLSALLSNIRERVRRWAAGQRSADPDRVEDVRNTTVWQWTPP